MNESPYLSKPGGSSEYGEVGEAPRGKEDDCKVPWDTSWVRNRSSLLKKLIAVTK